MKSANESSGWSVDGNIKEPDQRDFPSNVEGLQMTASSRKNSRTGLNRIDETRCNVTVEESDLLVNERNIDRQTHTHHNRSQNNPCPEVDESVYQSAQPMDSDPEDTSYLFPIIFPE